MKDIVISHGPNLNEYKQLENHWTVTCQECHKVVKGVGSSAFNIRQHKTEFGDSGGQWFCSIKCAMLWKLSHD